jgi:hypothetical protein
MNTFLYNILQWAEVWAFFIPLFIIIRYKITAPELRPIILYVWIAFIFNSLAVPLGVFQKYMPANLPDNNILYNIHTVIRFILFCWYIIKTDLLKSKKLLIAIIPIFLILVISNYIILVSPLSFNSNVSSVESMILLSLCIAFFLLSITDDSDTIWMEQPAFLVCAGISFYESIIFFIFLFFNALFQRDKNFGVITMEIFSVCTVILCIIFAIVLYRTKDSQRKLNSVTS